LAAILIIACSLAGVAFAVLLKTKTHGGYERAPATEVSSQYTLADLNADMASNPGWAKLKSMHWCDVANFSAAFDMPMPEKVTEEFLRLLSDNSISEPVRYSVANALIMHAMIKQSDAQTDNALAQRAAYNASGFQYNCMVQHDYTSAILYLDKAVQAVLASQGDTGDLSQSLGVLRDHGWDISQHEERAIQSLRQ